MQTRCGPACPGGRDPLYGLGLEPAAHPVQSWHRERAIPSPLIYRAQVRIKDAAKTPAARHIHLRPGMVASAEIKTGKRFIASYILDPILRTADEGLREP